MIITEAMLWTILLWLVFGLVVGAIARLLLPQPMSLLGTAFLGIAGSFVGGGLANLLSHHSMFALHPVGFIGSVLGTVLLLAIFMLARRRSVAW